MSGNKRRDRGDGSVFFDASRGCWVGVVDVGRDPESGRRVRRKVAGSSKTEAKEKLALLLEEKRKTGTVAKQDLTVERVVRQVLEAPPSSWRSPITLQVKTDLAQRIIQDLGKSRLVKLTPGQVEVFLRRMRPP